MPGYEKAKEQSMMPKTDMHDGVPSADLKQKFGLERKS